jgi:hypothetical protein
VRRRLRRGLSFLLLPLSVLPLVGIVPIVAAAHRTFQREHDSGPLAAPAFVLDPAERARLRPVPAYRDAVPVLAYQGVSDAGGGGTVSRRAFAAQMAVLAQMGYRTISIDEYARWRGGRGELPARPILVTFDGGRLDTYRGADAILERLGQRATVFVSSGAIGADHPELLTWRELKRMARSGRWDVQSAGHDEHVSVATGPNGTSGPFYAVRRYTRSAGYESLADFERRVTADLFAAKEDLERQGLPVRAIAPPGGDYGQLAGNDPHIAPLVSGLLYRQFDVAFVRGNGSPVGYTQRTGPAERYAITPATTLAALHAWLRASSPAAVAHRARRAARHGDASRSRPVGR